MSEMWLRINNKYFLLIKSHFVGVKASISFLSFKKRDHIKVHFHKKSYVHVEINQIWMYTLKLLYDKMYEQWFKI